MPSIDQPCERAIRSRCVADWDSVIYIVGSPQRTPSRKNCSAAVVLPVPATPCSMCISSRGKPPCKIASNPAMPVGATGGSCGCGESLMKRSPLVLFGMTSAHRHSDPPAGDQASHVSAEKNVPFGNRADRLRQFTEGPLFGQIAGRAGLQDPADRGGIRER